MIKKFRIYFLPVEIISFPFAGLACTTPPIFYFVVAFDRGIGGWGQRCPNVFCIIGFFLFTKLPQVP